MIRTAAFALVAFALLPGVARAQDAASWSFSFGAATENRSKDASKSDGEPFVWGEAQWESASGFFYAGPSFETIKASTGSDLEVRGRRHPARIRRLRLRHQRRAQMA